ncbi:arginine/serine-rich protein 1 [Gastrophryne carolinensis]
MTRTVDAEVPERGSTPSNVNFPDVAARNENYISSTSGPSMLDKPDKWLWLQNTANPVALILQLLLLMIEMLLSLTYVNIWAIYALKWTKTGVLTILGFGPCSLGTFIMGVSRYLFIVYIFLFPEFSNKLNHDSEPQSSKQKTNEMTNFMDDLSLHSPKERLSRSRSSTKSIKRRSLRSSSSSSSSSSSDRSSWSRSRSSSHDSRSCSRESRSASRGRKYRPKRNRRHSRSYSYGRSSTYSRSRSRSYSPRQRRRYCSTYRRYYRSPPRYRSRSRSHSRSYHRSRYSRSRSRSHGRRYYGFVRSHYSPTYRSWRSRSRSRSRGRSLHLSDKEKMELLEIAKMNASKILGKQVELPESLKRNLENPECSGTMAASGIFVPLQGATPSKYQYYLASDPMLKTSTENDKQRSDKSRSGNSSSRDSEILLQESRRATEVETETKHRSPYALWRPVISEAKTFSKGLSPKEQHKSRNR